MHEMRIPVPDWLRPSAQGRTTPLLRRLQAGGAKGESADKIAKRKERFGAVDGMSADDEEKAAKRKERFEAPKVIDPEEAERMAKRAARFGSGS